MNMIFGYCRISTKKQKIERQKKNILEKFPTAKIYEEIYTGTKSDGRKIFNRLMKIVRPGDTIVFDSVSRMSRNADDGVSLYMKLYDDGIRLVFLKEPTINTDSYRAALSNCLELVGNDIADEYIKATNRVLKILAEKQIRIAFEESQKEVDTLHQRTVEGMEIARRNGKQIGIKKGTKLNVNKALKAKKVILENSKSFGGTLNDNDCRKLAEVSRNTFYKYKRELRGGNENG